MGSAKALGLDVNHLPAMDSIVALFNTHNRDLADWAGTT